MTHVFAEFANHPAIDRLGWTLIHFLWQAMAVAVTAAACLRLSRKASANSRYAGLCAGLLVVAAAPVITFLSIPANQPFDVTPAPASEAMPLETQTDLPNQTPPLLAADPHHRRAAVNPKPQAGSQEVPNRSVVAGDTTANRGITLSPDNDAVTSLTIRSRVNEAAPWIVTIWGIGVVLLSLWHTTGWLIARRLTTRGTRPVPASTLELLDTLKTRMGIHTTVQLIESTATLIPIVVGWFRPVLLLPASVLSGLPTEELRAILAHELAHVRRHDILVNHLQTLVETCLFYHPAVWWLSRRIRIEREYCADDAAAEVCACRESYARALVSLADTVATVPRSTVAASGGSLTSRIHRLLGLDPEHERAARRPSWLASTVLGIAVIVGLFASTQSSARQPDDLDADRTPIRKVSEQLADSIAQWKLARVDDAPGVDVRGYRGYRVVLRKTWKEFTNLTQAATPDAGEDSFELRTLDWEFVLIPVEPKKAPIALKSEIPWTRSQSQHHTRDLCLGEGHGYVWFTHGAIHNQEFVRDKLQLTGGDDRIQLVVDGLSVKDEGAHTANSCLQFPARFGDRALPYVRRAIEQALEDRREVDLWRIVGCLAFIQTDSATEMLLQLFDFGNAELRSGAEYALLRKPYRPVARRTYMDMLRRQSRVTQVTEVCLEFEWRDSVPLLRGIIARPHDLNAHRAALLACRELEKDPIAPELLTAETTLRSTRDSDDPATQNTLAAASRLLIESDDTEVANLLALSLARRRGKGDWSWVNNRGIAILKARSKETTIPFLEAITKGLKGYERTRIERITSVVSGREVAIASDNPPTALSPLAEVSVPGTTPLPPDPFQRGAVVTPTLVHVPDTDWQIATTPVTNAQYQEFLDATGRDWPIVTELPDTEGKDRGYPWNRLLGTDGSFATGRAKHPVTLISREEATAYCRWLSTQIGGEFTLAPEAVYVEAMRGSRGVAIGRDELKRLGRTDVLDGTHRMWFPLTAVDAFPQYQSKLKCQVQGQSFYELTQEGVSQPNAWRADSSQRFLFEMHGPAQRLCVVGFRVAQNMKRRANTHVDDTEWINSVEHPRDRGTLHSAYQKVRDRRTRNEDQFLWNRPRRRGSDRELNVHFDAARKAPVMLSPHEDNLLMFRSRQLNDLDRIWIERVERQGDEFTVTAHRAQWSGFYTRNITYYDVFAVNIGKLPAGKYRAKLIIKPFDFKEYDGERWPLDAQPSKVLKPTELELQFSVVSLTSSTGPSAPSVSPTPQTPPTQAEPDLRPDGIVWGDPVNGLQAGLSLNQTEPGLAADRVRVGNRLPVQLTVRNVSKNTIQFTTVEPSFRVPSLHDLTGREIAVLIPPWDGPAAFHSHQLKPAESTTLRVVDCTIGPRVPVYNMDGHHIYAEVSHYFLSVPLKLVRRNANDWSGDLTTGSLRLKVISGDKRLLTKRVSTELKQLADELTCKVVYVGGQHSPSVAMVAGTAPDRLPSNWSVVKIDRNAALAIIEWMATEGHLWRHAAIREPDWCFPHVSYALAIDVGPPGRRQMLIPLKWSTMVEQIRGLRAAVPQAAAELGQILDQPLLSKWHQLDGGKLVGVSVEPALYERTGHRHFYMRFQVTNRTKTDVFVDLADYDRVFHPNQWGFHKEDHRIVIDESRMEPTLMTPERIRDLIDRAKANRLTKLGPGQSTDYYREFNRGGRADVEAQQKLGKYFIMSIDGQLLATDGSATENVNVSWARHWDDSEARSDVVIPGPVSFLTLPDDACVIEP